MNKRKLQEFASWAKQNLERQIELSLIRIGINSENDIKRSRVQGDITIIDGIETTFKRQFHDQRKQIIIEIKKGGFNHTIEQFASTWFNRIIALRFLEVHDYLDHGFKIFPNQPNTLPEILSKLSLVKDDLKLDPPYCDELINSGNNEELYRYVLFQQCNVLAKPLPMLFSKGISYLEYFIPTPLLFGDTIINRLIEIKEEDFKEDVEVIGWLYQYYVSFLREETRNKKHTDQNDIPILSQIFTPDWIVKYMAENSIGRLWLESYPSSPIKSNMKYYVEDVKQESDVEKKLNTIKYQNVNPEEIKIIEPCSGSGHILVYCFDLLLKMYLEKGYSKREIPGLILKNNLVGLDIDKRATQLASFALVMRARSIDNRFFEEGRYVRPKVYEIIDSHAIINNKYNGNSYKDILKDYNAKQWKGEDQLTTDELSTIDYVVNLFKDAKVVGSLLKVNPGKYLTIRKKLKVNFKENTQADIFTSEFFNREFKDLQEILRLAYFMSQKYDVMITNPPYLGITNLDNNPKEYLKRIYPDSKADMFSMFMEVSYVKKNGFRAMVNPDSWMFLKSFEQLRLNFCKNLHFINMAHHGMGEFDAVVQTTSFVIRNTPLPDYNGTYYRLVDSRNKEQDFLSKDQEIEFIASVNKYFKIPSYIFAYWISKRIESIFDISTLLIDIAKPSQGMATGDNNKFVRMWWEPNYQDEYLNSKSRDETIKANKKWVPYNKGGAFRKWYGNNDYVVYFKDFGASIASSSGSVIRNSTQYLIESITWGKIGSGPISFRYKPFGHVFDVAGTSIFANHEILLFLLALCNSVVTQHILRATAPTLNYEVGQISNIPVISTAIDDQILNIVKENVYISQNEWNSFETSWNFKNHPLLGIGSLSKCFDEYESITKSNFEVLKSNEETINEYFINLYELHDELSKEVDDRYVSISIADKTRDIKSLISYFVGVLMGRYSQSEEGLIYAGGKFDFSRYGNHDIDEDGILPLYSDISIEDGLVHRIIGMIKDVYGEEHYRENIEFIAEALGKKSNETNEETLNRYLNDEFYTDHLKIYKKRPIYWMFSSGKLSGFKCLIYMHRYNENTLAKINAGYFQPATTILRNQITTIEKAISLASEREKIQLDRKRLALVEQLKEAREYGQVLDYMSNKYISIDLDDGVKVNYAKFQGIEVILDRDKVKKDLLVPIK